MHCTRVQLPHGIAIVCRSDRFRPKRCACGAASCFQCDWKTVPGKTCDKHLCGEHAQEVAPDKHLCPEHQVAYREWQASRAAEQSSPA